GLEDERGVRRRIARRELRELPEIAGVRNDGGELFESIELVHEVDNETGRIPIRTRARGTVPAEPTRSVTCGTEASGVPDKPRGFAQAIGAAAQLRHHRVKQSYTHPCPSTSSSSAAPATSRGAS